jgi:hypothetical protein
MMFFSLGRMLAHGREGCRQAGDKRQKLRAMRFNPLPGVRARRTTGTANANQDLKPSDRQFANLAPCRGKNPALVQNLGEMPWVNRASAGARPANIITN